MNPLKRQQETTNIKRSMKRTRKAPVVVCCTLTFRYQSKHKHAASLLLMMQIFLIKISVASSSASSSPGSSGSLHSLDSDGFRFSTKLRNNDSSSTGNGSTNDNGNNNGNGHSYSNQNSYSNFNSLESEQEHYSGDSGFNLYRGEDGHYRYGKTTKRKPQQLQQGGGTWKSRSQEDNQEMQSSSQHQHQNQHQHNTTQQLQPQIQMQPQAQPQAQPPQAIVRLNQLQIRARNNFHSFGNPTSTQIPSHIKAQIQKRIHKGRITTDFGTPQSHYYRRSKSLMDSKINEHENTPANANANANANASTNQNTIYDNQNHAQDQSHSKLRITTDPNAIIRLLPTLFFTFTTLLSAFTATLRLLAPLVLSRKILCSFGNLISDWYTGRYFRKTYSRMEKIYLHYYETPAGFRALSRSFSQWVIYLLLSKIMGYLVGITHQPCHTLRRGLAFPCGLLWIGSVVGAGHAFAEAVAIWGGPLRLQAAHYPFQEKRNIQYLFTRPWQILSWMQNPEQWMFFLQEKERRRPFDPNPLLFPATWIPLRLLQMVALAKVAATEPEDYLWCPYEEGGDQIKTLISKYLLQLALCDEWYRVFFREKRLGLGIFVAIVYYFSMVNFLVSSAMINGRATLWMVPSLVAIIISAWMNIVLFWNRYETRRGQRKGNTNVSGNSNANGNGSADVNREMGPRSY